MKTGQANHSSQGVLCQIAFSVTDVAAADKWYREAFGFIAAGGTVFKGELPTRIQGLPDARSTCWWLVDRHEFFQLELFQFSSPMAKLMPEDRRPCDIGYARIGVQVADFEATLARLAALGTSPLTAPMGALGKRRVCVRDPEGVYVEIMEEDIVWDGSRRVRECPASFRTLTLSVADLVKSRRLFRDVLGFAEAEGITLHSAEHEALWGLPGARTKSLLFVSGDFLVEAVQYLDPVGKPRPEGYRVSDQGLLNFAVGFRQKEDLEAAFRRSEAAGYRKNCDPYFFDGSGVVYVNDDQEFSVELLYVEPPFDAKVGFLPDDRRPQPVTHFVSAGVRIAAAAEKVWSRITDHEAMSGWLAREGVVLEREGTGERNGRGAVRVVKSGGMDLPEEVVVWSPPHRYEYRVLTGNLVRNHRGCVEVRPDGEGSEVSWEVRFRAADPNSGDAIRGMLQASLDKGLQRLKGMIESGTA